MARRKTKFCTQCGMKFMGNHNCISAGKIVKYDDPCMADVLKSVVRGPDNNTNKEPETSNGNSGAV